MSESNDPIESSVLAELSPILQFISMIVFVMIGMVLAAVGIKEGPPHLIAIGIAMVIAGIVTYIWLDKVYFRDILRIAKIQRGRGNYYAWSRAKSFAESRGYGYMFEE